MLVPRFSTKSDLTIGVVRAQAVCVAAALTASLLTSGLPTGVIQAQGAEVQSASALSGAARWADSIRVNVERATLANDMAGLKAAEAIAVRALTAFPDDPLLLHYQAYAKYRQAQRELGTGTVTDAAEALFKDAIALLERSAMARPLPETYALMFSSMGTLAGTGMVAGMRYGMAAGSAEEKALDLAANNPRVLLLSAISSWFKPAMWGGGEDKGYAQLQRALKAFERDAPAPPLPAWGQAEAYAWLGQMEQKRGDKVAARAAYDRALQLAPNYGWVKYVLLPALVGQRG
jgi:tetratricopeptide (TPR) repeat protein